MGLTLTTTRDEIVSAILSGVTYEMKLNLKLLQSSGLSVRRLRVIGGGAKSPVWVQRKADIMGIPMAVLAASEAAALGVAMLGAKAAGLIDDLGVMAKQVVKIETVVEPNDKEHEAYQRLFAIYEDLYPAIMGLNHRLAALEQ